jgi:ppGpp synthetase/RelA/SpoT-type nucleotidyltranferase
MGARMTKPTLEEYPAWAKDTIGFDVSDEQFFRRYSSNTRLVKSEVESSESWSKFVDAVKMISDKYKFDTGYKLFSSDIFIPDLTIKPFNSVIEKTYRINILNNKKFPMPPFVDLLNAQEWVTEDNIYRALNDIIRGRMVCRYMDGPEYFCSELNNILSKSTIVDHHSMETDLGYYSWHFGIRFDREIMKPNGEIKPEAIRVEVQISTQLQEILSDLTHSFYENKRLAGQSDPLWKWRPAEPKFQGVYFGHALHMIEGMLVQLKNQIVRKESENDNQ